MTGRPAINPHRVEWSGENPGMYLKESAEGSFTTLVSFFRVVVSPHGRGHALILLEAPGVNTSLPEALNVCVTDNEPLARWLVRDFASSFGAFRGVPALRTMPFVPLSAVQPSGDQRASYMEWIQGDGVEVTLSWEQLGEPFLVELTPERSPTGRHEMCSLFVEAGRVTATVNGRRLRGRPVKRDFQGRRSSTAFLAFSETWLRADSPS